MCLATIVTLYSGFLDSKSAVVRPETPALQGTRTCGQILGFAGAREQGGVICYIPDDDDVWHFFFFFWLFGVSERMEGKDELRLGDVDLSLGGY